MRCSKVVFSLTLSDPQVSWIQVSSSLQLLDLRVSKKLNTMFAAAVGPLALGLLLLLPLVSYFTNHVTLFARSRFRFAGFCDITDHL